MKTDRHSKGLTLIELMTVVAILVLSLVLAAPSFSRFLDDRKVRNVAESLHYGMLRAVSEAANANTPAVFTWDGHTTWTITQQRFEDDGSGTSVLTTKTLETFNWGGADANWSSVSVKAMKKNNTALTDTAIAFDTFSKVSDSSDPNKLPDWFEVCGGPGSRKFLVTVVEGGIKVCDPLLPSTDPKGCKGASVSASPTCP
ncbi:MAG: prepilin-type N-terminal cleavage/methylation domain-containing protein [Proteobacteria bacterium]|nr:prepilin-type N-terminal cleavage/methylation domain-containing protein [Pseudomonadota bacterium]